jgi:hypothetical protein
MNSQKASTSSYQENTESVEMTVENTQIVRATQSPTYNVLDDNVTDLVIEKGTISFPCVITAISFLYGFIAMGTSEGMALLFKCDDLNPIMRRRLISPTDSCSKTIIQIESVGLRFFFITLDYVIATAFNDLHSFIKIQGPMYAGYFRGTGDYVVFHDGKVLHVPDSEIDRVLRPRTSEFNLRIAQDISYVFPIINCFDTFLKTSYIFTVEDNSCHVFSVAERNREPTFLRIKSFKLLSDSSLLINKVMPFAQFYKNKFYFTLRENIPELELFPNALYRKLIRTERGFRDNVDLPVIRFDEDCIMKHWVKNNKIVILQTENRIAIFDEVTCRHLYQWRYNYSISSVLLVNKVFYYIDRTGKLKADELQM